MPSFSGRQVDIVRAGQADFEQVWLLLSEYFETVGVVVRDDRQALSAYLNQQGSSIWLAYVNEQAAGCILLRPLTLPFRSRVGEIKRLYVKPSFRSRGIARNLLAALESYAAEIELAELYLDTKDDLTDALRFYENAGYVRCDRYNDNPQATLFLRKRLACNS